MREQFPDFRTEIVAFATWLFGRGRTNPRAASDAEHDVAEYFEEKAGHVHPCPTCYEKKRCNMRCTVERNEDGVLRGSHTECEECLATKAPEQPMPARELVMHIVRVSPEPDTVETWCGGLVSTSAVAAGKARVTADAVVANGAHEAGELCVKCQRELDRQQSGVGHVDGSGGVRVRDGDGDLSLAMAPRTR